MMSIRMMKFPNDNMAFNRNAILDQAAANRSIPNIMEPGQHLIQEQRDQLLELQERKRSLERSLMMNMHASSAEPLQKRKRVDGLPEGFGQSIPLRKANWWKIGSGSQNESIGMTASETTKADLLADPRALDGAEGPDKMSKDLVPDAISMDTLQRLKNLSRNAGSLPELSSNPQVMASSFRSLPLSNRASMSAAFSTTNPNLNLIPERFQNVALNVPLNQQEQPVGEEDELDDNSQDPDNADSSLKFRAYQAENWTEKFEELMEFRGRYGHCLVPNCFPENPALAQWVKRQRYQYKLKVESKRSTMSDERIQALDRIGFVWDSHRAIWDERLQELLEYRCSHGDCNVPSRFAENRQLAVWVKRQRRQYKFYMEDKPSSMTPERIHRLEMIGFEWDLRKKKGSNLDR